MTPKGSPMTPARRSILRLGLNITAVGLLTGALALGVADLVGPQVGFYPMVVVSGSMAPALPVGSLVIVERTQLENLVPGEIVTVRLKSGDLLTHRLGRVVGTSDGPALVLKGDANDAADPLPVPASSLVGQVAFSAPGIGFAFWVLRQPIGLVTFGALIAMLLMTARALRPRTGRPASATTELGEPGVPDGTDAQPLTAGTRSPRRLGRPGAAAPVLLASLALAVVFGSGSIVRSAALFNDSQALSGNTFSSGTWLTWRGPWSSGTTYYANEIVSYAGSSWIATVTTLAATPGVSSDWQLLAAKGDTGATGATGATGPTGPTGSTGATGPGYLATSTTSVSMAIGSKTFTTQAGLAYLANDRVRVSNSSSNYMEGVVTAYTSTTLTVSVDRFVGSGTFASWNIGLAGDVGPTGNNGTNGINGTNGAGYTATSTTSVAIGTGAKAFDTQAGLAYLPNVRVRVADSSSNYMEGVVASYTGTTLTVTVDRVVGSGTFASWNIGVAGDVGAQGPAGTNGTNGATGATGATGPAGSGWTAVFYETATFGTTSCLGLIQANHAACPSGTAANFSYNLGAPSAVSLKGLFAELSVSPASGKSWTVSVLDDGTSVLSCDIAAGSTGCTSSASVSIAAGHFVQVQVTPTGAPANSAFKVLVSFG
jgi:signal peptidase I